MDVALGVAPEIYKTDAILRLRSLVKDTSHSEYLILYFKNNKNFLNVAVADVPKFYTSNLRLTLDEHEDVILLNKIFDLLGGARESVKFEQVYQLVAKNPYLADVNKHIAVKYRDDDDFVKKLTLATTISKN